MKTYYVTGQYRGKVILRVKAPDLMTALRKFHNAEEDEIEVLDPCRVEYNEYEVKPAGRTAITTTVPS